MLQHPTIQTSLPSPPIAYFDSFDPMLVQFFSSKSSLQGEVNEVFEFGNAFYAATSNGLYAMERKGNGLSFYPLKTGEFSKLYPFKENLYAVGKSGFSIVKGKKH